MPGNQMAIDKEGFATGDKLGIGSARFHAFLTGVVNVESLAAKTAGLSVGAAHLPACALKQETEPTVVRFNSYAIGITSIANPLECDKSA